MLPTEGKVPLEYVQISDCIPRNLRGKHIQMNEMLLPSTVSADERLSEVEEPVHNWNIILPFLPMHKVVWLIPF